jgi:hypothetical protein
MLVIFMSLWLAGHFLNTNQGMFPMPFVSGSFDVSFPVGFGGFAVF